jgi:enamine deaminase RidA (YjgF/YER057c/UK114 family)
MEYEVISSPNAPPSVGLYSQATRAGDFIFCAGQAALDPGLVR